MALLRIPVVFPKVVLSNIRYSSPYFFGNFQRGLYTIHHREHGGGEGREQGGREERGKKCRRKGIMRRKGEEKREEQLGERFPHSS
jgi:hypothetical protein